MPKVTARLCPFTNKLYHLSDKTEYLMHLTELRTTNHNRYKLNRAEREWKAYFDKKRNTLISVEEIFDWIVNDIDKIVYAGFAVGNLCKWDESYEVFNRNFKLTRLTGAGSFKRVTKCSNTHSAPIGGVQNSCKKEDLPTSYPGFTGRYSFAYTGKLDCFPSDFLNIAGISTGSGGGGGGKYNGSAIIWLDDWPAMKEHIELEKVVKRLKGIR